MAEYVNQAPVMELSALADHSDVVIECAPAAVFRDIAEAAVEKGRIFMPLSCGQMLEHMDLVDRAKETGARIVVPTGALLGLDAVRGAAEGEIESVTMVTRKPPSGLEGAPLLVENNIDVRDLSKALLVFDGSAREAVRFSGECKRCRSAESCRHWAGSHDHSSLGGSWRNPKHAYDQSGSRFCSFRDDD